MSHRLRAVPSWCGWVWCLGALIGMTGCALPQHEERYVYEKDGVVVAEARRYAGRPDNPIHDLWIRTGAAPAFDIRLPDGVWASSTSLTFAELALHGMAVSASGEGQRAIWHPGFTPGALAGRHAFVAIEHDPRDNTTTLHLGACGWVMPAVIRAPDRQCLTGFPATPQAVECLLGPPARIHRVALVTGLSCF